MALEYEGAKNPTNQIVVWDRIVPAKAFRRMDLSGFRSKYPAADDYEMLPGKAGVLKLYWNTVPRVGYLYDSQSGSVPVKIPEIQYS